MNNIGHSSRLPYDDCAYPDRLSESVSPGTYRTQPYYNYNCNSCVNLNGPRASANGIVAAPIPFADAMAQRLVDIDSMLSNRDVKQSKCKDGMVNKVKVTDYNLLNINACADDNYPGYTSLSHPAYNYKEMPLNRFYNLIKDPQLPIFYNFSTNTVLEAKDNFIYKVPKMRDQPVLNPTDIGMHQPRATKCTP
jgi:hypothetical protein